MRSGKRSGEPAIRPTWCTHWANWRSCGFVRTIGGSAEQLLHYRIFTTASWRKARRRSRSYGARCWRHIDVAQTLVSAASRLVSTPGALLSPPSGSCNSSRFLLQDVIAKDESEFSHGSGLVLKCARLSE